MTGTWGHTGVRCRIKQGWAGAGREGDAFMYFHDNKGQVWIALQWDDDDDPDLHKAAGMEIKRFEDTDWEDVKV